MKKHFYLFLLAVLFISCTTATSDKDSSRIPYESATIAVPLGAAQDDYVTKTYPEAVVLRPHSFADMILLLLNKQTDYAAVDVTVANTFINNHPELEIVEPNLGESYLGAGFNYGNKELCQEFNDFLCTFKTTDAYSDLEQRWLIDDGANGVVSNIKQHSTGKTIRVGVTSDMPPYCILKDNELAGYDIELIKHFAWESGYQIQFEIMSFGALLNSIVADKVDMILSAITYTEERAKNILYSDFYASSSIVLVGKKTDQIETNSNTDYKNAQIALVIGTSHDEFVTKNLKDATIVRVEVFNDVLTMIQTQKADFGILDAPLALSYAQQDKNLVIVNPTLFSDGVGAMFNKNDVALQTEFNEFLDAFLPTDEFNNLKEYWLNESSDQRPVIEESNSSKLLKVGVNSLAPPYTFIQNNELVGFEVDLVRSFAMHHGYKVEFMDMNTPALLGALASEKLDMMASSISITEERKLNFLFSNPYEKAIAALVSYNFADANMAVAETGLLTTLKKTFYNNIIKEDRYLLILDGLWVTLLISIFSILLGTVVGGFVCYGAMSKNRFGKWLSETYVLIIRGTPVLILLMINFYVIFAKVSISPVWVAVVSFALNFGAYVSEMFRTSIQSIAKGQTEAGLAMGFSKLQTFVFIVAPQAINRVLPVYKGEAISLVKMTSVVGYIAVQDITKVGDIVRSRTFDAFFPLIVSALLYFLLAYLFSKLIDISVSKIINKQKS